VRTEPLAHTHTHTHTESRSAAFFYKSCEQRTDQKKQQNDTTILLSTIVFRVQRQQEENRRFQDTQFLKRCKKKLEDRSKKTTENPIPSRLGSSPGREKRRVVESAQQDLHKTPTLAKTIQETARRRQRFSVNPNPREVLQRREIGKKKKEPRVTYQAAKCSTDRHRKREKSEQDSE
jgi:hypothetical protein